MSFMAAVGSSTNLQSAAENGVVLKETTPILLPSQNVTIATEAVCRVLKANADYCDIEGDIRVDPNSSKVFFITAANFTNTKSLIIQPYPRKGIPFVKNWTITLSANTDDDIPKCTKKHSVPAILFSIGGFSGNHFHDFADLIVPLYTTSFHFKREVHFLASDYKPWWPPKFRALLVRLTKHGVVDIDREKDVHCYSKMILGLQFYKELIINPPNAFGYVCF